MHSEKIKGLENLPPIPELNNEPIQRRRRGTGIPLALGTGMNASKAAFLMAILTGVGIAGAIVNHFSSQSLAQQRAQQRQLDQQRAVSLASARHASVSGDMSNLPGDRAGSGDSLSMLNNANRGGFPDDQAATAVAAQAAANASANSDPKTDAPNPNAAPASSGSNGSGSAPNQNVPGGGSNSFGSSKIGQLSSGGGGGHGGLSGGGGMSGGFGRGFDPLGAGAGDLVAMARGSNPTITSGKTATSRPMTVTRGGANLARLGSMSGAMRPTASMGDTQKASQIQSDQWSSGQPSGGAGQAITGAGDSTGGTGTGAPGDAPAPNDGPQSSGGSRAAAPAQDITKTENVTPWQGMLGMAETFLMIGAALAIIAGIIMFFATKGAMGPFSVLWATYAKWIAAIAAIFATVALVIGGIIAMQYGQMAQGMVLAIGGAAVLTAAAVSAFGSFGNTQIISILAGAIGFGSSWMAKSQKSS